MSVFIWMIWMIAIPNKQGNFVIEKKINVGL